jgi:radical SAM superfamily enzyme YgiQ (UPF0313 family)
MALSSSGYREHVRRLRGREQGAIAKDAGGRIPVALVYPNSYRIGMSSLGTHQLYRLLNEDKNVRAERFFYQSPELTPISLESFSPLKDFCAAAFSISYELDYLNIPRLLEAAGIPALASERDQEHPLIIAGGACVIANPAPLVPFFDALAVGEAEIILPPLVEKLLESGPEREAKLKALAEVPGMIVPAYDRGNPVERQYIKDLDTEPCHTVVVSPDTEFGHMYMLEVQRGCGRGCLFCLVKRVFNPLRFRSLDNLLTVAQEGLQYSRQIGLVGPAVSSYPDIEELVAGIRRMGGRVVISSLAVKPLSGRPLKELALSGTRSVTLAPEAGSQGLRDRIGKNISHEDILQAVEKVNSADFKSLKLYFMVGLPGETRSDIEELQELVIDCRKAAGGLNLSINIAPFVPKPCTYFEREPVLPLEEMEGRIALLRGGLSASGIKVKFESPAWSRVQAVLARGDEKLAPVIASLQKPSLTGWKRAMQTAGLDENDYLDRWPSDRPLPWHKWVKNG